MTNYAHIETYNDLLNELLTRGNRVTYVEYPTTEKYGVMKFEHDGITAFVDPDGTYTIELDGHVVESASLDYVLSEYDALEYQLEYGE